MVVVTVMIMMLRCGGCRVQWHPCHCPLPTIASPPLCPHLSPHSLQRLTPERGFSTFKFLPGSGDNVIVAIKSAEEAATDRQTAYITVYKRNPADDSWKVVMEETEIPGDAKFEGLEVIDPDN